MKDNKALSSVQALDDYFDALLDDTEIIEDAEAPSVEHSLSPTDSSEFQPKPKMVRAEPSISGATLTEAERDLANVERLLSQLTLEEETDVAEVEVEVETSEDTATSTVTDEAVEEPVATDIVTEPEIAPETDIEVIEEAVVLEDAAVVEDIAAAEEAAVAEEDITEVETETEIETSAGDEIAPPPWQNIAADYAFQVLFFESFGVTYAVPLADLGGIHRLEECNHLIGRPDWYLGLQTERDQQLDIVDTAKWVMPEKIADNSHRDDYSYIVLLGDSKWGLACNTLLGTESLDGGQVRWREQAGKRPWLAGLVKEKMCALIHVEALVAMLNQGIDASALA